MSNYLYLMRFKTQFASHTRTLLERFNFINSIEELDVETDRRQDDPYDSTLSKQSRPYQAHTLFLVQCNIYRDEDKQKLHTMIDQGLAFDILLRVDKYEISNEEIWKS